MRYLGDDGGTVFGVDVALDAPSTRGAADTSCSEVKFRG